MAPLSETPRGRGHAIIHTVNGKTVEFESRVLRILVLDHSGTLIVSWMPDDKPPTSREYFAPGQWLRVEEWSDEPEDNR